MQYKVIKENNDETLIMHVSSDYDTALAHAVTLAKDHSSSEFHDEILEALDERGYYMCGWSSTQIRIEME